MSAPISGVDLDFRPTSYFWPLPAEKHLLSTIKGVVRRRAAASAIEAGALSDIPATHLQSSLSPLERDVFSQIHPSFMGGEYLPDFQCGEIEIARINVASSTSDVTSVFAKRCGRRIAYRIVDEYEGGTLQGRTSRTSMRPLTLGQLTDFFLGAYWLPEILEMNQLNEQESQDFVNPSSAFYPDFETLIRKKASECGAKHQAYLDYMNEEVD